MSVGTVGERLLTLRAIAKCDSWREVDRLAGLSEKMSSAYVRGKTPEYPAAAKLATLFGTTVEWLLTGRGDAPAERRVRLAFGAARRLFEGGAHRVAKVSRPTGSRKTARPTSARA